MKGLKDLIKVIKVIKNTLALFLLAFLLSSCVKANPGTDPLTETLTDPEPDPFAPVFVSSLLEKTDYGSWVHKHDREQLRFEPWEFDGRRDPKKPKVTSDHMASTGGPGLDQYVAYSDLILIGTCEFSSDKLETEVKTGTPVDDKIKEVTGGSLPKSSKYYHYIKPEKILWQLDGSSELSGLVPVYQFAGEIQIKDGDRVALILCDRDELGWVGVCFEHGNFLVKEDGTVSTFSDYLDMSKYDGMTVEDFEELLLGYIEEYQYAVPYSE